MTIDQHVNCAHINKPAGEARAGFLLFGGMVAKSGYYASPHWQALRRQALARDSGRCVTPSCCAPAVIVDHIQTRPAHAKGPTKLDVLGNLRSLCRACDNQVKERRGGRRANRGTPEAFGCDVNGLPISTAHPWNRGRQPG